MEEVEFAWKGGGKEVFLTADFLNWAIKLPLIKLEGNLHSLKQKLQPGTYTYKFIVDGRWCHSPDSPTVDDGNGGFNNYVKVAGGGPVKAPAAEVKAPAAPAEEGGKGPAPAAAEGKAAADPPPPPAPKAAVAKKAMAKKGAAKAIWAAMAEDIIPQLTAVLSKEKGLEDLEITFDEDKLTGTFIKDGVRYSFWCYFPDKTLEGARGFSLTSHGAPPSTVEPFLIDERKVTGDLFAFWVQKRLYAQKILSVN